MKPSFNWSQCLGLVVAIAMLLSAVSEVSAQVWNKTAGGNWNSVNNWASGTVPNSTAAAVTIGGGTGGVTFNAPTTVTVDGSFSVGTLAATSAQRLDLSSGDLLFSGSGINAVVLSGSGTKVISSNLNFTTTSTPRITLNGGAATISGVITGSGLGAAIQKWGSGTLTLTGNNTFTGSLLVDLGALVINSIADSGTPCAAGQGVNIRFGTASTPNGILVYTGPTASANRRLQIGVAAGGGGGEVRNNGTGELTLTATQPILATTTTENRTLTLSGSNNGTIQGGITNNVGGGLLGVIKDGGGRWTLAGNSAYSGATVVRAGRLHVTGSIGNSATSVMNSGTLSGGGAVGSLTLISQGTVSPGNGVGTLNAGATTFADSGRLLWEINNATGTAGANSGWDKLAITGALNIVATPTTRFTINLATLTSANVSGPAANFNSQENYSFTIITAAGGITGFDPDAFVLDTSGFQNPTVGSWTIAQSGNSLVLNYAGDVPPPPPPPPPPSANLLFKSNFGPGVIMGTPRDFTASGSAWQDIVGTDSETGFSWPIAALGADNVVGGGFSGVQIITGNSTANPVNLNDFAENTIVRVVGPQGNEVNALFLNLKQKGPVGTGVAQLQFMVRRPWTSDTGDLYITYWFKHQADLAQLLDASVSNGNWRAQFEFKTGGYNNTGGGDYRIAQHIFKDNIDGSLYWFTKGDNLANAGFPAKTYWIETNTLVPVPVGEWFKYEVFIHRSGGADGRFWGAVNGQTFVDHRGPNMGDLDLPITRLFLCSVYSGGAAPVQGLVTGLEIWNGFPPAGVSPAITSVPSAAFVANTTGTFQVTATGSPAPTFSIVSGSLPDGVTLNGSTGLISGTPSSATGSPFVFAIKADNGIAPVATQTFTLTIDKAPAAVTIDSLSRIYDGLPKNATVTTNPAGLAVSLTYDGGATAPTNTGSYAVSAVITDPSYVGSATGTLVVAKAPATVMLGGLATTYNGTPRIVTFTTNPAGLNVVLDYDGSAAAPTDAGSYVIAATINDANYFGGTTGTLVVAKAPASITLAGLNQTYDGTPRAVSATTSSAGLNVVLTYDGTAAAPTNAGSYSVNAVVSDPNYFGSASGTLVIAKAPATIVLAPLSQLYDGTPRIVTATTDPADLTVGLTYDGSATAPVAPGSYTVDASVDEPNYTGSATGTLVVTTTALVRHAPSLSGGLDGSAQVLTGESFTLNGNAWVSGDLLVPGTPSVRLNGHPIFGGTIDGPGSAGPSDYQVTLNGNAILRHLVQRTDPLTLPTVSAPPAPAGTRDVAIQSAGQSIGDPATLRNLTLNGNAGNYAVPPGTYGTFVANGSSGFILGDPDSATQAVYNLQGLSLDGQAQLHVIGPVLLVLAQGVSIDGNTLVEGGSEWLTLAVASGGLTLNGNASFTGSVIAPSGSVTINGNATFTGSMISDRLTINGNGLLEQVAH